MNKLNAVVSVTLASALVGGCAPSLGTLPTLGEPLQQVAEYEDKFSRSLYAVVGGGVSRLEPDASAVPEYTVNDRIEPAGQITIGADVTKHLSVEAHSSDLGSAGFSPEGRINYHVNGASALLYAGGNRDRHRRQGLTAYGRVGVGALENSAVGSVPFANINKAHLLVGGGVEYMTGIGVGLRAEGVSFDTDVQYAQLGLMYRMGSKQEKELPRLAELPVMQPVAAPVPVAPMPVAPVAPVAPVVQPVVAAAAPLPAPVAPPVYTAPIPVVQNECDALSGVLDGVAFHSNSAGLTRVSLDILDQVGRTLSNCEGSAIHIQAHTDARGSMSDNQQLSRNRALSVVGYLISNGVQRGRMQATAFGESKPIASNDTESGRQLNRRVELHVR